MTPVERLQAAIAKLEGLRIERGYVEFNGWLAEEVAGDVVRDTFGSPAEDLSPITNDELLVLLHRTIDAQLTLLLLAIENEHVRRSSRLFSGSLASAAEALANAILGSDS